MPFIRRRCYIKLKLGYSSRQLKLSSQETENNKLFLYFTHFILLLPRKTRHVGYYGWLAFAFVSIRENPRFAFLCI